MSSIFILVAVFTLILVLTSATAFSVSPRKKCNPPFVPAGERHHRIDLPDYESLRLTCKYKFESSHDSDEHCPFFTQWYKDGKPLRIQETDSRFLYTSRSNFGHSIKLHHVSFEDNGNYSCLLVVDDGQKRPPDCDNLPSRTRLLDTSCYPTTVMRFFHVNILPPRPSTAEMSGDLIPRKSENIKQDVLYFGLGMKDRHISVVSHESMMLQDPFDCYFVVVTNETTLSSNMVTFNWHFHPEGAVSSDLRLMDTKSERYNIQVSERKSCGWKFMHTPPKTRNALKKRGLYSHCFRSRLKIPTVHRIDKGDYLCDATFKEKRLVHQQNLAISASYSDIIGKHEEPSVRLVVNTTTCIGQELSFSCSYTPIYSTVSFVKVTDENFKDMGLYSSFDVLTPSSLGNYVELANSKTHVVQEGIRVYSSSDENRFSQETRFAVTNEYLLYTIKKSNLNDSGLYACVVVSDDSTRHPVFDYARIRLENCEVDIGKRNMLVVILLPVLAAILIALMLGAIISIIFYNKRKSQPLTKRICLQDTDLYHALDQQLHGARREFPQPFFGSGNFNYRQLTGTENSDRDYTTRPEHVRIPQVTFERLHGRRRVGDAETMDNCPVRYQIPKDPVWEVSRGRVRVGPFLGEGSFGAVHYGEIFNYRGTKGFTPVAIKHLKKDFSEEDLADLMKEITILKQIKTHKNIIALRGVATKNGPLSILLEYAPHGNMREFLKQRPPRSSRSEWHMYENTLPVMPTLSEKDLVNFALGVCSGLKYLSSIPVVHRDIAARNILMGDEVVPKIADFGMTRNVEEYYRKVTNGRLPIKWLSPEALSERKFTVKSDVWAYGILLFEMFSFASTPYASVSSDRLLEYINNGSRCIRPTYASDFLWQLMNDCWAQQPSDRPTFVNIDSRLNSIIPCCSISEL